jgi:hypothetical protein
MAGNKKKGKAAGAATAAETASPKPTGAAVANSSRGLEPCVAVIHVVNDLLECKSSLLQRTDLWNRLNDGMQQTWESLSHHYEQARLLMDEDRWLKIIALSASLVALVSKVLSPRKRARDWKQAEYCSALCSALTAATAVLRVPTWDKVKSPNGTGTEFASVMKHPTALGPTNRAELLRLTAAAQSELCQLLPAALQQQQGQSDLQQQQQQRQPAAQSTEQQQQQQQPMWQAAKDLSSWWVTIDGVWSEAHVTGPEPIEVLTMQKPALELAFLLTQTLTADNAPGDFTVLTDVTVRYVYAGCRVVFTSCCAAISNWLIMSLYGAVMSMVLVVFHSNPYSARYDARTQATHILHPDTQC